MSIVRGDKVIAGVPIVDGTLNTTSRNPIQNQAVANAVKDLSDKVDLIIGDEVYTKSEVDTLLNNKADKSTTYTKTEIDTKLATLYPIGSIYIGTQTDCPLVALIPGSIWEKVAQDRVLQGSSNTYTATTQIEAGLPNITGILQATRGAGESGAFTNGTQVDTGNPWDGMGLGSARVNFDASLSSSIYGNSSTVQPPAYVVNIWRRTA